MLPSLIRSGRHFVIQTPEPERRPTIVAGYPWFDDWGRDTLISLPGLTFCSGRSDLGVAILKSMGPHERDGLIPNFFGSRPEHNAYNSIDASLWYFWAVQQMLAWTGDAATVRAHFWPVMQRILRQFTAGTVNGIFTAEDGLLHAGDRTTQLTWMDAQAHGVPVTPRHGCAVEINALWYNALCFANHLAHEFGEPLPWPTDRIARLKDAFGKRFWMDTENCLADVFNEEGRDASVRPNQIVAVSLPYSPLDNYQRVGVVEKVRKDLLTPYGLRTLSPKDPAYRGRYEGDQETRDASYHQGTVWPWLLGHFGEAYLRVTMDRKQAVRFLMREVAPLLGYSLKGPGLLNVPEIFDGDPPHRANGCVAQAWSTAELIRLFTLCSRGFPE
jgi:predicted glycogen debranching enzyme